MTAWPKPYPDQHKNPWNRPWCARCTTECLADSPCRCCETARADEAEAECNALSARLIKAVPASYVAMKERALRAEAALERVREFCEQQVKDRSGWSDDRHKFDLSYIDGWNDALDRVEQALGGGTS